MTAAFFGGIFFGFMLGFFLAAIGLRHEARGTKPPLNVCNPRSFEELPVQVRDPILTTPGKNFQNFGYTGDGLFLDLEGPKRG